MTLTADQIQAMNQVTGLDKPVDQSQGGGQSRANEIMALGQQSQQQKPQMPGAAVGNAILDTARSGWNQMKEGFNELTSTPQVNTQNIKDAAAGGGPLAGIAETGAQVLGAGAHGVATLGKIAGGAATIPLSPMIAATNAIGTPIGNAIGKSVPDKVAMGFEDTLRANPQIGQQASDMSNMLNLAVPEGAEKVAPTLNKAGDIIKSGIDKMTPEIPPGPTPQDIAARQTQQATEAHAQAKSAIEQEVRNTAAKYPSVSKVLNRSEVTRKTDPISVLASYPDGKALPTLERNKIQVDKPVQYLTDQISRLAKIKENIVKEGQQVVTPDQFKSLAFKRIDGMGWSAAKKAAMKGDVTGITESLKETYPDGIPNTEMDLIKSEHQTESTSYGSKSPFRPDAHAIVGQTAKELVEKAAPQAPLEELNKLISSHYEAIKLLLSMRGKAPHGGALSRMFRNTLGEVGGLGAGMTVGHPFLGAMVGRAGAELVNDMINNHFISNPLKRAIVNHMPGVDPEVVAQAKQFLEGQEVERAAIPKLPPGKPAGSAENPHIMPPAELGTTASPQTHQTASTETTGDISTSPNNTTDLDNVHTTITNHLDSAEQVIKELPAEQLAKQGGLPSLLEQTRENIALSLEKAGMPTVAKSLRGIDLSAFKDFASFKQAVLDYVKNIQPGLSMKESVPDPAKVAENLTAGEYKALKEYQIQAPTGKVDANVGMKVSDIFEKYDIEKPGEGLINDKRITPSFSDERSRLDYMEALTNSYEDSIGSGSTKGSGIAKTASVKQPHDKLGRFTTKSKK